MCRLSCVLFYSNFPFETCNFIREVVEAIMLPIPGKLSNQVKLLNLFNFENKLEIEELKLNDIKINITKKEEKAYLNTNVNKYSRTKNLKEFNKKISSGVDGLRKSQQIIFFFQKNFAEIKLQ